MPIDPRIQAALDAPFAGMAASFLPKVRRKRTGFAAMPGTGPMLETPPLSQERRRVLGLVPIDDAARDGSGRVVTDGFTCALVCWRDGEWIFPAVNRALDFEPTHYATFPGRASSHG